MSECRTNGTVSEYREGSEDFVRAPRRCCMNKKGSSISTLSSMFNHQPRLFGASQSESCDGVRDSATVIQWLGSQSSETEVFHQRWLLAETWWFRQWNDDDTSMPVSRLFALVDGSPEGSHPVAAVERYGFRVAKFWHFYAEG